MRAFIIPVLAAAVVGCGGKQHEYRSEEGRFVVRFPGEPDDSPNPDLPGVIKQVRLEQQSGTLSVAWEDIEIKEDSSPEERLDQACNAAATQLKGKKLSHKVIALTKAVVGREALIAWPDGDGVVQVRFYLYRNRLFSVLASGPKWWVESSPTRAFMASFRVVEW